MVNKKKRSKIRRHGDVVLVPVEEIPSDTCKPGFVHTLALGEVTGHHHDIEVLSKPVEPLDLEAEARRLDIGGIDFYETADGTTYIDVKEPSILTHQEHNTIPVEKGKYEIRIEREHDPFAEHERQVID